MSEHDDVHGSSRDDELIDRYVECMWGLPPVAGPPPATDDHDLQRPGGPGRAAQRGLSGETGEDEAFEAYFRQNFPGR